MIETSLARSQRALNRLINLAVDNHVYKLGEMIRFCPGRTHAWYMSKFGPVKKSIQLARDIKSNPIFNYTILERVGLFVKKLFKR